MLFFITRVDILWMRRVNISKRKIENNRIKNHSRVKKSKRGDWMEQLLQLSLQNVYIALHQSIECFE